ncbi:gluconokinase [Oceaniglobus roseus]|uniref:gluconokinase n=1 Tax=Oceaniglobus roseus TaxID=1737570 RepID=UPI001C12B20D|nr:gluconokinase [Kandeliimicrobium roseum]
MNRFVIMGVAGSGKSLIGDGLARALGGRYVDGDDLHPASNIAKMSRGEPLTDDDRWPWLDLVGGALAAPAEGPLLVGCSALKRAYRDRIRTAVKGPVMFLHLAGSRALIESRMSSRKGHFMPTSLLDSQFAALEPPGADEESVTVNIDQTPDAIVAELATRIRAQVG